MAARKPVTRSRGRRKTGRSAASRPRAPKRRARPVKSKPRPRKAARAARPAKPAKRKKVTRTKRPVRRSQTPRAVSATRTRRPVQRPEAPVPSLDRARRRLSDDERLEPLPDATDARMISSAKAGHDDLQAALQRHTETSPSLTAGDVDAKWEDAYAVGDEAPGGDNPTPGQDRVDDIGRALGVNYDEGEELKGSDKIADRDRHRWELDPASSDDWPHDK